MELVSSAPNTLVLIHEKSISVAVEYGALFGLGTGVSMGYGSYAAMPITAFIAHIWFFSTLIKMVLAGYIVGVIVKA